MARRRLVEPPAAPIEGRPFTVAEVDAIRRLIAEWNRVSEHPHPSVARLEAIHRAAGRTRGFKTWELDRVTDIDRAVAEEVASCDPGALPHHKAWPSTATPSSDPALTRQEN